MLQMFKLIFSKLKTAFFQSSRSQKTPVSVTYAVCRYLGTYATKVIVVGLLSSLGKLQVGGSNVVASSGRVLQNVRKSVFARSQTMAKLRRGGGGEERDDDDDDDGNGHRPARLGCTRRRQKCIGKARARTYE